MAGQREKQRNTERAIESKTHSKKGVVRLKSVVNERQITVQTIGLITELKSKFSTATDISIYIELHHANFNRYRPESMIYTFD